jgi:hypothetical protein
MTSVARKKRITRARRLIDLTRAIHYPRAFRKQQAAKSVRRRE